MACLQFRRFWERIKGSFREAFLPESQPSVLLRVLADILILFHLS